MLRIRGGGGWYDRCTDRTLSVGLMPPIGAGVLSIALSLSLGFVGAILVAPTACAEDSGAPASAAAEHKNAESKSIVLTAMEEELERSMRKLKNAAAAPLYYLSYSVYDVQTLDIGASYGALGYDDDSRSRNLYVELRVGDKTLDNTHQFRSQAPAGSPLAFGRGYSGGGTFPLEDDRDAIRTRLWDATDGAFKQAQIDYMRVKTNRDVRVAEEDASSDFSSASPVVHSEPESHIEVDRKIWAERLRKASAIFKEFAEINDSSVTFNVEQVRRFLVNSEGSRIEDNRDSLRITAEASAIAKDGMVVRLYDGIEVPRQADLPSQEKIEEMVRKLARAVVDLRNAPPAQPFVGPAILNSKAAGVFFHEVLGHRVEGHRQKDETEGRTFAQKVGEQIMPAFMSVYDDPTCTSFGAKPLVGWYRFDNEGVPAQRVQLVERGVLKGFLMGRSPIRNFESSNGHGRGAPGASPVARQGNLIIDSAKRVPYGKLKAMLIQEAKAQRKPYGLIIDEIAGGFTITQTFQPQSYSLLPLRVTRVYVDGRPDELTRGVNIVGTPLSSLEKIVCAARDDDTFNGRCGAESGWVPVSATAPSLLVKNIELEKEYKQQDQPPILPPPVEGK
ncbi:MAG: peptidase U62 [Candidatus Melainabacteria bacterium]|nr:peptidase U62 [Candidatus Melainabacteria bacterium]